MVQGSKEELIGEMIRSKGGKLVTDWVQKLFNIAFESSIVSEEWRATPIVNLHEGKVKICLGIILQRVFGDIYARALLDGVHKETEGLTDDKQRGYKSVGDVQQIMCGGFMHHALVKGV